MSIKKEITKIIYDDIKREGKIKFAKYLNQSDYFIAPCSTRFHLNREGGLAEHSLNVYYLLTEKVDKFKLDVSRETMAICGLFHDLCKVDFYVEQKKWRKDDNGRWESYIGYGVDDLIPLGHGERSMSILQDFMHLTIEEKVAIRWHNPGPGSYFKYPLGYAYQRARDDYPLLTLLSTADQEATAIIEGNNN